MAQEGGKSEIGAVSIGITGDIAPLQASLDAAKAAATKAGKETGKAFSDGLHETKDSIAGQQARAARELDAAGAPLRTQREMGREDKQRKADVAEALRLERSLAGEMQSMEAPVAKTGSAMDGLIGKLRQAGRESVQFLSVFTRIGVVVGIATAAVAGLVTGVVHLFTAGERANKAFNELRKSMESSFDKFNPKAQGIRGELDEISSVVAQESDKINQARNRGEISAKRARGINNLILAREEFLQEQAIKRDALKSNLDALGQAEEARLKKNEEYFNRRMEQKKLQIEQERAIEDDAFAKSEARASQQQDRLIGLGEILRGIQDQDPIKAASNRAGDMMRPIVAAWENAKTPIERIVLEAVAQAVGKAMAQEKKNIEQTFKDAMLDALNSALQASGGTGSSAFANMTVQLSEIAAVTRAINMNIPRDSP